MQGVSVWRVPSLGACHRQVGQQPSSIWGAGRAWASRRVCFRGLRPCASPPATEGGQGPFWPPDNNHSHFILVEPGAPER